MKKNKTLVVALIITMLMAMCSVVNAAGNTPEPTYSATFSLSSNSKLEAGSTVVAKLKIAEISAGEGIDAIVATLNFDSNVLEIAGQSSLVGTNGWAIGAYNSTTHTFTMTNSSKVNSAQDILTITFNVKQKISVDSTQISVKNISVSGGAANSGGTGDIMVADTKVTIQAEKSSTGETTNTTNTVIKTNTTNTTINSKKLPQTGVDNVTISLIVLSVVVLGTVCYGKYRNLNK